MKNTKDFESRAKFNAMFNQLKDYRNSLEKDDSPIVDIFNHLIKIDLIKKTLNENRNRFIEENNSKNNCDFSRLFNLIRRDYQSFLEFSKYFSGYQHNEEKVLEVDIQPKQFISVKDVQLTYKFKTDIASSLSDDLKEELLGVLSKLYLKIHNEKQYYYFENDNSNKYIPQGFFSDYILKISRLFFARHLSDESVYFIFDKNELKVPTSDDDLSLCGNKLFICDFFEKQSRWEDLLYVNKYLLEDNSTKEELIEMFANKIKLKIDSKIESLLNLDSGIYSFMNIELGNVPIDLYTDDQILSQIRNLKKCFNFSTIENIKKITSKEQFERFINLLSQI